MFPLALMGILTRAACQLGEGAGSKIGTPPGSLALRHSRAQQHLPVHTPPSPQEVLACSL